MLINIVVVGSPKNRQAQALTEDYIGRVRRYTRIELTAIKQEPVLPGRERDALRREAIRLAAYREGSYNVVLDRDGEAMGSESFAKFLKKRIMDGTKVVTMMIGGPQGFDASIKKNADRVLSLSGMTFPHELVVVIVAEQIYRAFAIMHGLPYHR